MLPDSHAGNASSNLAGVTIIARLRPGFFYRRARPGDSIFACGAVAIANTDQGNVYGRSRVAHANRPIFACPKRCPELFVGRFQRKGPSIDRHEVIREPRMVDLDVLRSRLTLRPVHSDRIPLRASPCQSEAELDAHPLNGGDERQAGPRRGAVGAIGVRRRDSPARAHRLCWGRSPI